MEVFVNAIGDACPIPVVKAKKALAEIAEGQVVITVDNQTCIQNLKRMAANAGHGFSFVQNSETEFVATLTKNTDAPKAAETAPISGGTVVAVGSDKMGSGDDELGTVLIKAFIFALTQQDELPKKILFYNTGARLTCEGSACLADIKALSESGVEIFTCGTCLNHFGIKEKLQVGEISNMYAIVEMQNTAGRVVRP